MNVVQNERRAPFVERRRLAGPGLVLVVLQLLIVGCGGPTATPLEPVLLGSQSVVQKRVADLVDEHIEKVRAASADATAHGTLGLVYEANELWEEAAASYGNAAILDPGEPIWRFHRAVALQQRGYDEEAYALLVRVAEELPQEAAVLQRLGDAYLERGQLEKARTLFESATRYSPGRAEGYFGLGAACWELEDVDAACEALERAVLLDPALHAPHYLLGTVYRELGRTEDAEVELSLGLNRTPTGDPHLRGNRALPGPFARDIRRYAVTRTALMMRAIEQLGRGKVEIAKRILGDLHAEFPDDIAVLNNLAYTFMYLGEKEAAMELWDRALAIDPDSVDTHMAIGRAFVEQGFASRAVKHARRALELAPELGETHFVHAGVLRAQGANRAAVQALERSVELDPRRVEAWLLLGECLLDLERYQEAARAYRRATRAKPDDVQAHLGLARAAIKLERRGAAIKAFESARRLGPDDPSVLEFALEFRQ